MRKILKKIASIRLTKNVLFAGGFVFVFLVAGVVYGGMKLFKKGEVLSAVQVPKAVSTEMPGWWYQEYFGASVCATENCKPESDPDSDKLTNAQEYYYKTNPFAPDTNKNGLTDGDDVAAGYDPSKPGKVTFEEAMSDETVLGESIIYGDSVKEIINDLIDPTKLTIPEVKSVDIIVSNDNSEDSIKRYLEKSREIMDKELGKDVSAKIQSSIASGNAALSSDLKNGIARTELEIRKLAVPSELLDYHKYTVVFLQLLPVVIDPPTQGSILDEYDPAGNFWYEKTQVFALVMEKMDQEVARLNNKLQ